MAGSPRNLIYVCYHVTRPSLSAVGVDFFAVLSSGNLEVGTSAGAQYLVCCDGMCSTRGTYSTEMIAVQHKPQQMYDPVMVDGSVDG